MSENIPRVHPGSASNRFISMQPPRSLRLRGEFGEAESFSAGTPRAKSWLRGTLEGFRRRFARERRRRKVGRAYDMALEIARVIPKGSAVLDVGCGNGYIAHHLSAMLGTPLVGIDLTDATDAPIDYRQYDGVQFPVADCSVDALLFCYVLHHAQDIGTMMNEARRVLRDEGLVVVYEDIPQTWWDKGACWIHNRQWKGRTGPSMFRVEDEWRALFRFCGFEIVSQRQLSRWRNLTHPVTRRFCLLRKSQIHRACPQGC